MKNANGHLSSIPSPQPPPSSPLWWVLALGATPIAANAADEEALDEDFLEYLAEFDDEDDDWSWFDADDKPVKQETRQTQTETRTTEKQNP